MKPLSPDTTTEGQQIHFQLMRHLPGWKRLALACELTQTMRKLIMADIQQRFPEARQEEIRQRFIARVLPRDDVIRVYGFDPSEKGY